ncbi:MAG: nucleotide exchange factor GrpE [Trueperaceae bacterium]
MTDDTNNATLKADQSFDVVEPDEMNTADAEVSLDETTVLHETLETTQKELETMKVTLEDYKDKYLRSQADLQTYRRRVQGDIDRARDAGLESALLPVMSVYDDLGRALSMATDPEKLLPGLQSVRDGLERNLDMLGIKKVGEKGETFNPEFHEALTMVPVAKGAEAGTIAEVFEVGFVKGEKLVRPAKVVVYQES